MEFKKTRPNILITGTPGTGKTTHAIQLLEALQGVNATASKHSTAAGGSTSQDGTTVTGRTNGIDSLNHGHGGDSEVASTWRLVNVGDFVKEKGCHSGFNEEWQSWDVDEDELLDELELVIARGGSGGGGELGEEEISATERGGGGGGGGGGIILDWHTCDLFPERWIDLVVVLRCDHSALWTRLEKRGYSLAKIQENNTAEIMEVVLEDARESYAKEVVVELQSDTPEQVEENVSRIVAWVEAWQRDHA